MESQTDEPRLRIRNWHQFQHFKDRRPPWIKLYREILDDIEWHDLPPNAAKVLVMLWLLASESDGVLPPTKTLAFRLRMTEVSLNKELIVMSHWLEQVDVGVISERYQSDAPETETETETEQPLSESKPDSDGFELKPPSKNGNGKHPYDAIIREEIFPYYVTRCDRHPVAYKLTPLRMKKGVSRFEDALTITENDIEKAKALMKCAIDAIAENPFNMGQNEQKTTYCDWIDHIFKSTERFQKLIG